MFAPPAVAAMAGRLVDALPHRSFVSPTVNVAITNVPGPRRPVHLAGRPLESSHPALSISDLTPLHIGLQSGPEVVGLGAVSCRDTLDDLAASSPQHRWSWTSSPPPSPAGERRLALLLERGDPFGVVGGAGDAPLGGGFRGEHVGELSAAASDADDALGLPERLRRACGDRPGERACCSVELVRRHGPVDQPQRRGLRARSSRPV